MIVSAPARRAPMIADRPTPPAPKTATLEPGVHLRPVDDCADAGHDGASDERGHVEVGPGGSKMHDRAETTACRANVDR